MGGSSGPHVVLHGQVQRAQLGPSFSSEASTIVKQVLAAPIKLANKGKFKGKTIGSRREVEGQDAKHRWSKKLHESVHTLDRGAARSRSLESGMPVLELTSSRASFAKIEIAIERGEDEVDSIEGGSSGRFRNKRARKSLCHFEKAEQDSGRQQMRRLSSGQRNECASERSQSPPA
jgi:hypothetical protein